MFTERHAILQITASRRRPRQESARHQRRGRDVRSLVGLQPPARQATTDLLVTPAARLRVPAEGRGSDKQLGEAGLAVCEELFWAWEIYAHTHDRAELQRRVRVLQRQLKAVLREHSIKHARYRESRRFARAMLKIWPALWTFANHAGVQPTNNHAERCLRGAVIYRKLSLGSQSHAGEQRIVRLLSAHTTCRLQRRSLHAYLIDVLTAQATGQPTPLLA